MILFSLVLRVSLCGQEAYWRKLTCSQMFLEVWRLSGQLYVLVSSFIFEEVQDLLLRLCVACTGNTPMFSMCDCVQCVVVSSVPPIRCPRFFGFEKSCVSFGSVRWLEEDACKSLKAVTLSLSLSLSLSLWIFTITRKTCVLILVVFLLYFISWIQLLCCVFGRNIKPKTLWTCVSRLLGNSLGKPSSTPPSSVT